MSRRRFDHLHVELSVSIDHRISRYALWLHMHEMGFDPEDLKRDAAVEFCEKSATDFLAQKGFRILPRRLRQLQKEVERYDPSIITPYEHMARFGASPD